MTGKIPLRALGAGLVSSLALAATAGAQAQVLSEQKISSLEGGFGGGLDILDQFGSATAAIGDLNGDGVGDLVVGACQDDDVGQNRGAVYVLFMNADGTVASQQKISDSAGTFTGPLGNGDNFGWSATSVGDIDADGVLDFAVGAPFDDDGYG